MTVLFGSQVEIICSYQASDPLGADFWCCARLMTDNARRLIGLLIAPLLILVGLWLCLEGLYGKLSDGFWVGPFVAIAGGLWLASDWFDF